MVHFIDFVKSWNKRFKQNLVAQGYIPFYFLEKEIYCDVFHFSCTYVHKIEGHMSFSNIQNAEVSSVKLLYQSSDIFP